MQQDPKSKFQSYLNKALDNINLLLDKLGVAYNDNRPDSIEILCPIHGSQKMGNSIIYKESGVWLCFSDNCNQVWGKNIINLIGACLDRAGKPSSVNDVYDYIDNENCSLKLVRQSIRERQVVFRDEKSKPESLIPSVYFMKRGYSRESLINFEVGDCHRGPYSDRSIVPVRYIDGQYMGFSARIHWPLCNLCGYHHSKYSTCISRDYDFHFMHRKWYHSKGLQKTMTLYGIEKIKGPKVAIVEGPGCVWKLYDYGIPAVACMGKDISYNQINLLKALSINSILFLPDNDDAGKQFKQNFIMKYSKDFRIYLPKLTSKDISEMSDQDIQELIVSEWKKI